MQRKRSLLYPVGTVPSENDYCYIHWVQYLAITVTTVKRVQNITLHLSKTVTAICIGYGT